MPSAIPEAAELWSLVANRWESGRLHATFDLFLQRRLMTYNPFPWNVLIPERKFDGLPEESAWVHELKQKKHDITEGPRALLMGTNLSHNVPKASVSSNTTAKASLRPPKTADEKRKAHQKLNSETEKPPTKTKRQNLVTASVPMMYSHAAFLQLVEFWTTENHSKRMDVIVEASRVAKIAPAIPKKLAAMGIRSAASADAAGASATVVATPQEQRVRFIKWVMYREMEEKKIKKRRERSSTNLILHKKELEHTLLGVMYYVNLLLCMSNVRFGASQFIKGEAVPQLSIRKRNATGTPEFSDNSEKKAKIPESRTPRRCGIYRCFIVNLMHELNPELLNDKRLQISEANVGDRSLRYYRVSPVGDWSRSVKSLRLNVCTAIDSKPSGVEFDPVLRAKAKQQKANEIRELYAQRLKEELEAMDFDS